MKWTIVLVIFDPLDNFAAAGAISRCISSIRRLQGDYELVAVNNNPLDKVPALTECLMGFREADVTVLEPNAALGTTGGFNLGLKNSTETTDYVAFMSIDCEIIDPQMLVRLEQTFIEFPSVGVLHPFSIYEDIAAYNLSKQFYPARFYTMVRDHAAIDSEERFHHISNTLLKSRSSRPKFKGPFTSFPLTFAAIRRSVIHAVGEFDGAAGASCGENDDFTFRCVRGGFLVGKATNTVVYHHRYLFYRLTHPTGVASVPHAEDGKKAQQWWLQKWGKPYPQLYFEWRWGKVASICARPYFACRPLVGKLKWKRYKW